MFKLSKKLQILGIAATCLGITQPAFAEKVTMTFGHTGAAADTSDDHISSLAFKEYVERESNGDIEVQLFPAQQLGNAREMAEQISSGALDAEHMPIVFLSSFIPELSIIEMPYLLDDHKHAQAFASGPIVEFLSTEISKAIPNVTVANLSNTGNFRSFYTTVPVKSASDLSGVKVRTVPSPLAIEFVKQLGAEPVPMGWGEVYSALQSGLVQGTKNAAIDVVPSKLDDVVKYGVLDRHSYLMGANLVSQSFMDKLSDEHKKIVMDGFNHISGIQTDYNVNFEAEAQKIFAEHGGAIHEPSAEERATFVAAREPVMEWYKKEFGENGVRWLAEFSKQVEAAK